MAKTPIPKPKFFPDHDSTFSTKKERRSPRSVTRSAQPKGKTAPPLSRVYPRRWTDQRPHFISFKTHSDSLLSRTAQPPRFDDTISESYLEQAFFIEEKIGEGSFGEVFRVRHREDGRLYAVKRAITKFRSEADRAAKLREVQKHEGLPRHPNLVGFERAWEERGRLFIQTELCRSNLAAFAEGNHTVPEPLIWNYLVDLLLAVQHLHNNELLHLDIKPENIFISQEGICKLGDFGLVFDLRQQPLTSAQEGDAKYLSPELLHEKPGKAADVFSLGITLLEVACDLDLPIHGEAWQMLRRHKLPWNLLSRLTPELQSIIMVMLEPNPAKRPSASALLRRPELQATLRRRKAFLTLCRMWNAVKAFFFAIFFLLRLLCHVFLKPFSPLLNRLASFRAEKPVGRTRSGLVLQESPAGQRGYEEHASHTGSRLAMPLSFDDSDDDEEDEGLGDVSSIRGDREVVTTDEDDEHQILTAHHHSKADDSSVPSSPVFMPSSSRLRRPFNSTPANQQKKRSRVDASFTHQPRMESLTYSPVSGIYSGGGDSVTNSPSLKRMFPTSQPLWEESLDSSSRLRSSPEPSKITRGKAKGGGDEGFRSPLPPPSLTRRRTQKAPVSPRNLRLAFDHHGSSSEDES